MRFWNPRSRKTATAVGAALLAVSLIGCSGQGGTASTGEAAGSKQDADTLVITRAGDPTSLDPAVSVATGSGLETLSAFYERLVNVEPDGTIVPALAESWEISEDGLAYTFHLREGVLFHDGSPFTAEEVRYTWQRIVGLNDQAAQYWPNVSDVEVVDDTTAVIRLNKLDPTFLSVLGGQRGVYMGPSKACVEANEAAAGDWAVDYFVDHECGTGAYELESWNHDETITFTAFEDYWQGWDGAHVTKVVQQIVSEPSTVQMLLTQGDVDLAADNLPMQVLQQLKDQSGVVVDVADSTTIDQMVFNLYEGPTTDPRVREAISLLFDYDAAIQQAYAGQAERIATGLPSTVWPEVTEGLVPMERDVERAKELLAEAGYPDGFELEFAYADINQWSSLALILEASLGEGGIKVTPVPSTWPVLFEKLGNSSYGMAGYQMWAAYPDPNDILMWWNTDQKNFINPGWGDAASDALITQATETLDVEVRADLYRQVVERLEADMPAVWVDQPMQQTALRDYVSGFVYNPYYNGLLDFYALSKTA